MLTVDYKNFKCEDCGSNNFTLPENFAFGKIDITIYCANKECGASYTFRPVMKYSSSSHPSKRCSCKMGLLSREDKYCSCCGKKNPKYGYDNTVSRRKDGKNKI